MNIADLSKEFPRDAVHWRVQGQPYPRNGAHYAMALAYIDARDVMDRLDEVCGPENWQARYIETPRGRVLCEVGVCIENQWVWKSDGAGDTAVEGEKGGISDALKRAAVHWGIGRYLYRLDSPWVKCEVKEKGGKVYWKAWAEDPWSRVKVTTYNAAANSAKTEQEVAPQSHPDQGETAAPKASGAGAKARELANDMITGIQKFGAGAVTGHANFQRDIAWLEENSPGQFDRVQNALNPLGLDPTITTGSEAENARG